MSDEKQQAENAADVQANDDVGQGPYLGQHGLASPNGHYGLFMQDDGTVEVRHDGNHVRNL